MHLCTVCLAETDYYLICNYFGYLHGFSLCQEIECVHLFQIELKPSVILMGLAAWE